MLAERPGPQESFYYIMSILYLCMLNFKMTSRYLIIMLNFMLTSRNINHNIFSDHIAFYADITKRT